MLFICKLKASLENCTTISSSSSSSSSELSMEASTEELEANNVDLNDYLNLNKSIDNTPKNSYNNDFNEVLSTQLIRPNKHDFKESFKKLLWIPGYGLVRLFK